MDLEINKKQQFLEQVRCNINKYWEDFEKKVYDSIIEYIIKFSIDGYTKIKIVYPNDKFVDSDATRDSWQYNIIGEKYGDILKENLNVTNDIVGKLNNEGIKGQFYKLTSGKNNIFVGCMVKCQFYNDDS